MLPARQDADGGRGPGSGTTPADSAGTASAPGPQPLPGSSSATPDDRTTGTGTDGAPAGSSSGPPPRPRVVREPGGAELVTLALGRWREALVERAGDSALSDVDRLGDARLDLSTAHPSGIAQLFAGRTTRLSNLVRDGGALASARRRARAVGVRADDHAQRYGLASAFLAIGVATWTEEVPRVEEALGRRTPQADDAAAGEARGGAGTADVPQDDPATRTVRAPVLLRPLSLRPQGRGESDYDLTLEPSLEVNPLLATALRSRGALLDPSGLARATFTESGFDPQPGLARLTALGEALLPDFDLEDRLLVGTFVHPEQVLVDDLDALEAEATGHEVLRALAGDARTRAALARPLPSALTGDRPLEQERGVGDLDPAQAHVLDAVAAGHHLLVDAPAGSDTAGTLAAIAAEAAAAGRTVLYVAGHRRAGEAFGEQLTRLGLGELVLDVPPESGWRARAADRLLAAMTVESVDVPQEQVEVVERELVDRRRRLQGYVDALHRPRTPWGVSAYDALQALAGLTATRPAPRTRVRLAPHVARALTSERRGQAIADLIRAAGLGAFGRATRTSPWYGSALLTRSRADDALQRVERLLGDHLPRVQGEAERVAETTGLTPARTPDQWAEQLTMLAEIRQALDVFQPMVFERSAADLVAATATKEWRAEHGVEMPGAHRRRLRKQAKDMVRPGRPVADLHGALVHVQAQREVWQAHCPAGGWPRLPEGLAAIEHENVRFREDLLALAEVLSGTEAGGDLTSAGWDELAARLRRLRADASALDTLPERNALVENLSRQGLGELLDDLGERQVPAALVGAELQLAWWSTVVEQLLSEDPALAGYDGTALTRLVAEFRALDRRHLHDRSVLALAAAREALRTRLHTADDQTQELFGELVEHRFTGLRPAVARYPDVVRHLRPCLVASPMLVPQLLPPRRGEDLVLLDAAGHLALETVVPALVRGRQVVVVGDTRCASGTALPALAEVLPTLALQADAPRRDPHLTAFLADHGYAGRLTPTPLPATEALLRLDVVDGVGMPGPDGTVEATEAEVDHVVELVLDHALTRPEETLAVLTVSARHAHRVREAVLTEVRENPALGPFFASDRPEPFVVASVGSAQGLSRDAVVLSVGYGRTPHGRVLHRFGPVSEPGGEARLLEALGVSRRRLDVVACFGPDELDPERLRAPGARLLRDLLGTAAERSRAEDAETVDGPVGGDEPDRLVLDLAERLWRKGLTVDLHHGVEGGSRLPLVVGHPELPGEWLVAVLTDDAEYVGEPSVRVRDRQVPERLQRLGWSVVQVWSAAAFLDPEGEVEAIADVTVEACRRRWAEKQAAERPTVPTVPSLSTASGGPAEAGGPAAPGQDGEPGTHGEPGRPGGGPDTAGSDTAVPDTAGSDTAGSDDDHDVRDPAGRPEGRQGAAGTLSTTSAVARVRGSRPDIRPGLPPGAYTDDQLDELVQWILGDGVPRHDDELTELVRRELGVTRRGARIDAAVEAAVRRARR